jgi:hypothetical protein
MTKRKKKRERRRRRRKRKREKRERKEKKKRRKKKRKGRMRKIAGLSSPLRKTSKRMLVRQKRKGEGRGDPREEGMERERRT